MDFTQIVNITVVFLIGVLATRFIFSIPVIVKNLKAHTALLALIAAKSGDNKEQIMNIAHEAGVDIVINSAN